MSTVVTQKHGFVPGNGIEKRPRRVEIEAIEECTVPLTAGYPGGVGSLLDAGGNGLLDLVRSCRERKVALKQLLGRATERMQVRVDESRQNEPPGQFNDVRVRPDISGNGCIAANKYDFLASDRHRLCFRQRFVNGMHDAAA